MISGFNYLVSKKIPKIVAQNLLLSILVPLITPNMSEFLRENPPAQENVQPKTNLLDPSTTSLDFLSIKKVNLIFRALNHKLRQQIIRLIDKHGKVSVTEIFVELRLDQSVASQHLAIIRRAGLLLTEREGKFMYYKLNQARLEMINQMVVDLLK